MTKDEARLAALSLEEKVNDVTRRIEEGNESVRKSAEKDLVAVYKELKEVAKALDLKLPSQRGEL